MFLARTQGDLTEDVGGQPLLSVLLLEGLLPEGWGEIQDASARPRGQQAEKVAQVAPRLDAVELAARPGASRKWRSPRRRSSLPRKTQCLAPDGLAAQRVVRTSGGGGGL